MLLRAMGEVTRAQVMTGQAFEDSFHRSFHVYMDFFKPVLDVVLKQQASSDEAETPLSSAWNFLYRQLTIIAMFKKEASDFRLTLQKEIRERSEDFHFVIAKEGFEAEIGALRTDIKNCVGNAIEVMHSEAILGAVLPASRRSEIPVILAREKERAESLAAQIKDVEEKSATPTIMISGRISVGKTTFVKAVLQAYTDQLVELPLNSLENTHAITRIEMTAKAHPTDSSVIAVIDPDGEAIEVKNWTAVKDELKQRIDKDSLNLAGRCDDVVLKEVNVVPVVKIRIYGCSSELTVIDTPGSEGIGCDYTSFLEEVLVLPVFLCSFNQPTLFDESNKKVLDFLTKVQDTVVTPPAFIFTRHAQSIHNTSEDDGGLDEEQKHQAELQRVDGLATLLSTKRLQKPITGAPNALAAVNRKNKKHEKAKADMKSLCRVLENLGKLFQPLMGYGRCLGLLKKHMAETVNDVFSADLSKAIFGPSAEFEKFKGHVTDEMMKYVDDYVHFLDNCSGREQLVRKLTDDDPLQRHFCRGAYAEILKMEGLLLDPSIQGLPVRGRSKSVYVEQVVTIMADKFQERLQADLSLKAGEILAEHTETFMQKNSMMGKMGSKLSMSLPCAMATGVLSGMVSGGAVMGGLVWFEVVAFSAGPPGWIAGICVGVGIGVLSGSSQVGLWKTDTAVKQCTDCVLKDLHDNRGTMKNTLRARCKDSLDNMFEDLSKLRKPGEDDEFKESLASMDRYAERVREFVSKVRARLRAVNFVAPGDPLPTKVLKESLFNQEHKWTQN